MAPLRKKARRMNARNRPSSTQEELVDTDSDDDIVLEVNATTTTMTPFGKENRPPLLAPVLTQGTANAAETLFLIKKSDTNSSTTQPTKLDAKCLKMVPKSGVSQESNSFH